MIDKYDKLRGYIIDRIHINFSKNIYSVSGFDFLKYIISNGIQKDYIHSTNSMLTHAEHKNITSKKRNLYKAS